MAESFCALACAEVSNSPGRETLGRPARAAV